MALNLVLSHHQYDEIISGRNRVEYRENNPYYIRKNAPIYLDDGNYSLDLSYARTRVDGLRLAAKHLRQLADRVDKMLEEDNGKTDKPGETTP